MKKIEFELQPWALFHMRSAEWEKVSVKVSCLDTFSTKCRRNLFHGSVSSRRWLDFINSLLASASFWGWTNLRKKRDALLWARRFLAMFGRKRLRHHFSRTTWFNTTFRPTTCRSTFNQEDGYDEDDDEDDDNDDDDDDELMMMMEKKMWRM